MITAARARAQDPTSRTDWSDRGPPELSPPATSEQVTQAEKALGCVLHPLHRRLLQEIGNGGFGPGDGLIGIPGGRVDDLGRSVVELRRDLFGDELGKHVPTWIVPICDWGDGDWSCIDESTGNILMLNESGLTDSGMSLQSFISDWLAGVTLAERLFTFEEHAGTNPFTGEPMTVRMRGRPVGTPYRAFVE